MCFGNQTLDIARRAFHYHSSYHITYIIALPQCWQYISVGPLDFCSSIYLKNCFQILFQPGCIARSRILKPCPRTRFTCNGGPLAPYVRGLHRSYNAFHIQFERRQSEERREIGRRTIALYSLANSISSSLSGTNGLSKFASLSQLD